MNAEIDYEALIENAIESLVELDERSRIDTLIGCWLDLTYPVLSLVTEKDPMG